MVTDGTTLLGADDKAGVAEIMTAVKYMLDHPEFEHGDVYAAFTPDEEIGRGTENFEKEKFPCDYAYTMDGDAVGGVEYECFNAASLNITVTGYSIHPGSAKNKMINAMNIAHEYHSLLPKEMRPEHTEGREGFFHLDEMSGTVEEAKLGYIIRDHDYAKFMRMKKMALDAAEFINTKYGKKLVQAKIKDSYRNMADCFSDKMYIAEIAKEAWKECGVTPVSVPIRGGTDGASLTFMGIPCPNMGTGGGNFHGRFEYCCIDDMDVAVNAILKIIEKTAKRVK
ncbi:MAG: peptidase T, partial [Erysipelotrichales bacterium]|nr:peptidase T [Erysipelotrichales bacterium]